MTVTEAVASRFSARAFLDTPVDRATLERILQKAQQAPSGGNVQPWRVYVLRGQRMLEFKELIQAKLAQGIRGEKPEYHVYPPKLKEPYRSRRFKCGEDLYASIGVPREDKPGRLRQFAKNMEFFGAGTSLFFAIDRIMGPSQWAHLGMYMQTIMLLAREAGLHTCAQEAWSNWHETIHAYFEMPEELMFYCGLAIGHLDEDHPINGWRTDRAPLDEVVQFKE